MLRTRFILFYLSFLLISTFSMFQLEGDPDKVAFSLLNILLIVVPLFSVTFTTIHFYNSYEFMKLMLAQPINRINVFLGQYAGVALSLVLAYLIGVGLPLVIYGMGKTGGTIMYSGVLLTLTFTSFAFLVSVINQDKAKAIGVALLLWFYFSLIYDAFILYLVYNFSDYPLEKPILALISLNPIDLARVLMLLKLDLSALMGYTGAFYKNFFGSSLGRSFSTFVLLIWIILPLYASIRIFRKKDF